MPAQLKMWMKKIRLLEKPDCYKAHLDPSINQKEIMFIGKLVFLFKTSILQEKKLWIWVQARCLLLPSFLILAICAIWQILRVFQLNFCSTLLRKISSNHLWILQGISKQNIFLYPSFKGQSNSEWIYEVIVSPKMPTKNLEDFCFKSLLEGKAEILQIFDWHYGRNGDLINSF